MQVIIVVSTIASVQHMHSTQQSEMKVFASKLEQIYHEREAKESLS
eukprot:CAMPEP_0173442776 /NCGR_PEP_ID=MMETSP1357-20121228/28166_1 /TAXON_ID=77926 /ORGANISM="Hemiselmis rufescens, Strain PCC563" /LENGTH=45 /DNA_ID= /DNA_START= /DNA_END= /DNA_ORIENTATION=